MINLPNIRMGLINPDVWTTYQGVQKANTYVSFADETIHVSKEVVDGVTTYVATARYRIFWDQAARLAGRPAIDMGNATARLTDLNQNIYTALYAEVKKVMPNAIDEL